MDTILNYLGQSLLLDIVLVLGVMYAASRLLNPGKHVVPPEDLVPAYKRFERRESLQGDRRHDYALAFTGRERRQNIRRVDA